MDFLRRLVAGADVPQIVELPPRRGPTGEERVLERGEVRLSEEAWQDGDGKDQEQPWAVHEQGSAERHQRQHVLPHREELCEQADAVGRLPPCPLKPVIERGVFEVIQIKGGSVLHQAHAGRVGEEFAEQALDQHRGPGQHLPNEHDDDLERHELPQPRDVR